MHDFEFQFRNGEPRELTPIAIPRSFGWDILPAYDANNKAHHFGRSVLDGQSQIKHSGFYLGSLFFDGCGGRGK